MFELEFLPINKNEESTWILHESKELNQDLLDFIESNSKMQYDNLEMALETLHHYFF